MPKTKPLIEITDVSELDQISQKTRVAIPELSILGVYTGSKDRICGDQKLPFWHIVARGEDQRAMEIEIYKNPEQVKRTCPNGVSKIKYPRDGSDYKSLIDTLNQAGM